MYCTPKLAGEHLVGPAVVAYEGLCVRVVWLVALCGWVRNKVSVIL